MGYKSLIQSQVKSALKLIGDLGTSAVFSNTSDVSYNFGSQEIVEGNTATTTITIFETERSRGGSDTSPLSVSIIADSTTTVGLDQYDTVAYLGNTYNLSSFDDNGFITTMMLQKEA